MSPEKAYEDLTPQELADEVAGLDDEIESCQNSLGKIRRAIKQKQDLRESLIEILTRSSQMRGWQTR
jgi:prefoldin subunit 5